MPFRQLNREGAEAFQLALRASRNSKRIFGEYNNNDDDDDSECGGDGGDDEPILPLAIAFTEEDTLLFEADYQRWLAAAAAAPSISSTDIKIPAILRHAKKLLHIHGPLRDGQAEVVHRVLARQSCLAVMPTGHGKSLLYQLPLAVGKLRRNLVRKCVAKATTQRRRLAQQRTDGHNNDCGAGDEDGDAASATAAAPARKLNKEDVLLAASAAAAAQPPPPFTFGIVVSPLVALMQDQVLSINSTGFLSAKVLSSEMDADAQERILERIAREVEKTSSLSAADVAAAARNIKKTTKSNQQLSDQSEKSEDDSEEDEDSSTHNLVDILFVAPERIVVNANFRNFLRRAGAGIAFFCFDEAHCLSEWGQDFRPSFLYCIEVIAIELGIKQQQLMENMKHQGAGAAAAPPLVPVVFPTILALTATASNTVTTGILEALRRLLPTARSSRMLSSSSLLRSAASENIEVLLRGSSIRQELKLSSIDLWPHASDHDNRNFSNVFDLKTLDAQNARRRRLEEELVKQCMAAKYPAIVYVRTQQDANDIASILREKLPNAESALPTALSHAGNSNVRPQGQVGFRRRMPGEAANHHRRPAPVEEKARAKRKKHKDEGRYELVIESTSSSSSSSSAVTDDDDESSRVLDSDDEDMLLGIATTQKPEKKRTTAPAAAASTSAAAATDTHQQQPQQDDETELLLQQQQFDNFSAAQTADSEAGAESSSGQQRQQQQQQEEEEADEKNKRLVIRCYHAGLTQAERRKTQKQFMANEVQLLVATVAFGMGINKPDIRTVIHATVPSSVESYVQEVGRAGRDGKDSAGILLYDAHDYFNLSQSIASKLLSREQVQRIVWRFFDEPAPSGIAHERFVTKLFRPDLVVAEMDGQLVTAESVETLLFSVGFHLPGLLTILGKVPSSFTLSNRRGSLLNGNGPAGSGGESGGGGGAGAAGDADDAGSAAAALGVNRTTGGPARAAGARRPRDGSGFDRAAAAANNAVMQQFAITADPVAELLNRQSEFTDPVAAAERCKLATPFELIARVREMQKQGKFKVRWGESAFLLRVKVLDRVAAATAHSKLLMNSSNHNISDPVAAFDANIARCITVAHSRLKNLVSKNFERCKVTYAALQPRTLDPRLLAELTTPMIAVAAAAADDEFAAVDAAAAKRAALIASFTPPKQACHLVSAITSASIAVGTFVENNPEIKDPVDAMKILTGSIFSGGGGGGGQFGRGSSNQMVMEGYKKHPAYCSLYDIDFEQLLAWCTDYMNAKKRNDKKKG